MIARSRMTRKLQRTPTRLPPDCHTPPVRHQGPIWPLGNEHRRKLLVNVHANGPGLIPDTGLLAYELGNHGVQSVPGLAQLPHRLAVRVLALFREKFPDAAVLHADEVAQLLPHLPGPFLLLRLSHRGGHSCRSAHELLRRYRAPRIGAAVKGPPDLNLPGPRWGEVDRHPPGCRVGRNVLHRALGP
jgi:hypothetical protein